MGWMRSSRGKAPLRMTPAAFDEILTSHKTLLKLTSAQIAGWRLPDFLTTIKMSGKNLLRISRFFHVGYWMVI